MAFTGTAVVTPISQNAVRITGLSLAGAATGDAIVFSDRAVIVAGSVEIPGTNWEPYEYGGAVVSLQSAVRVTMNVVTDVTDAVPISVVKSGTTHDDFAITLHNDSAATVSAALEIYIEFR